MTEEIIKMKTGRVVKEEFREMARVVKIEAIHPIPKKDKIELAVIGGWQVIVKKGEYAEGDTAIYIEIDGMVPVNLPEFAFLLERKSIIYDCGEDGVFARIKTLKMGGVVSQGLLVKPTDPNNIDIAYYGVQKFGTPDDFVPADGLDAILMSDKKDLGWLTRLGIWVAGKPLPSLLRPFPAYLQKSEQPRVQNIGHLYAEAAKNKQMFEKTLKVDGSSMTVYAQRNVMKLGTPEYETGVCQRNNRIDLTEIPLTWEQSIRRWAAMLIFTNRRSITLGIPHPKDPKAGVPEGPRWKQLLYRLTHMKPRFNFQVPKFIRVIKPTDNVYAAWAINNALFKRMADYGDKHGISIAVQGELAGPGVDKNKERLTEQHYFVYTVYVNGRKVVPTEARRIVMELGMEYVPVFGTHIELPAAIKDCLKGADGPGHWDQSIAREGFVYKAHDGSLEFKVISNNSLVKEED